MALANSQWQFWMMPSLFHYFWAHCINVETFDEIIIIRIIIPGKTLTNIILKFFYWTTVRMLLYHLHILIVQTKSNSAARPGPQFIYMSSVYWQFASHYTHCQGSRKDGKKEEKEGRKAVGRKIRKRKHLYFEFKILYNMILWV